MRDSLTGMLPNLLLHAEGSRSKAAIIIGKLIKMVEHEYNLDGFCGEIATDLDPLHSAERLAFRRSKESVAALATCSSDKAREHRQVVRVRVRVRACVSACAHA